MPTRRVSLVVDIDFYGDDVVQSLERAHAIGRQIAKSIMQTWASKDYVRKADVWRADDDAFVAGIERTGGAR